MDARSKIDSIVRIFPGLHFREVQRMSGLATGVFQYHLNAIEKSGAIVRERDGRLVRLYPKEMPLDQRRALGYLRHETIRRILIHIIQTPDVSVGDLARKLRISPSTVSYYLNRLTKTGLLKIDGKAYSLTDEDMLVRLLVQFRRSFLDRLVDSFVSLWEARGKD